jgi:hypothetical protein
MSRSPLRRGLKSAWFFGAVGNSTFEKPNQPIFDSLGVFRFAFPDNQCLPAKFSKGGNVLPVPRNIPE